MTDKVISNIPAARSDVADDEFSAETFSGKQLNLTTDDLAHLLDIKEAQRDRAHTLLAQAQAQLSAAQREVAEAEEGVAVVDALAKRGLAVSATLA